MSGPNRIGFVYCENVLVGALTEYVVPAGYEYEFRYDEGYVVSGRPAIGFNLPVTDRPYRRNHLPAFFANLMSEGWVKRHQAQLSRLDEDDKFGLLLGHGAELIGPLRVLTEPLPAEAPAPVRQVIPKKDLKGYRIDFPRSEFNSVAMQSLGKVSISGVQPKMFLSHHDSQKKTLTNAIGLGPYIVKPSPSGLPELAQNEFMIMRLCRLVGFNVADHFLVPFSCGEPAYVTSRFDIDHLGRPIGFVEDMASCMDVAPSQKSSERLSYEWMLRVAHSAAGYHAQILRDGFLQVLMSYIVGNNDLHLKNVSLVRPLGSDTAIGFSALYDMVCVAPYREYDNTELALFMLETEVKDAFSTTSYSQYGYYTEHDFVTFAEAIGLGSKVGRTLIKSLTKKVEKHLAAALACEHASEQLKQIIGSRVQERLATLSRPWL